MGWVRVGSWLPKGLAARPVPHSTDPPPCPHCNYNAGKTTALFRLHLGETVEWRGMTQAEASRKRREAVSLSCIS